MGGAQVCASLLEGGNYYWKYRLGLMDDNGYGMSTYFVYWKDGSNRILIDAKGDESGDVGEYSYNPIRPNDDKDISKDKLILKYPDLKQPFKEEIFKFIPWTDKDKWISTIRSINDGRLETAEDVGMFIDANDPRIYDQHKTFAGLEKRFGLKDTSQLYKKYIWNDGYTGYIDLVNRYLSNSDRKTYEDDLVEDGDLGELSIYLKPIMIDVINDFSLMEDDDTDIPTTASYYDILKKFGYTTYESFLSQIPNWSLPTHLEPIINDIITDYISSNNNIIPTTASYYDILKKFGHTTYESFLSQIPNWNLNNHLVLIMAKDYLSSPDDNIPTTAYYYDMLKEDGYTTYSSFLSNRKYKWESYVMNISHSVLKYIAHLKFGDTIGDENLKILKGSYSKYNKVDAFSISKDGNGNYVVDHNPIPINRVYYTTNRTTVDDSGKVVEVKYTHLDDNFVVDGYRGGIYTHYKNGEFVYLSTTGEIKDNDDPWDDDTIYYPIINNIPNNRKRNEAQFMRYTGDNTMEYYTDDLTLIDSVALTYDRVNDRYGSKDTYLDGELLATKNKDGSIDYSDDTDAFFQSKDSRYQKRNIRKESVSFNSIYLRMLNIHK